MKKKAPLISIITICYNIENEIERTLKSIRFQDMHDYELIVVDGGSSDSTPMVLDKYRDIITILISEPDNGIYDAMNKGLVKARGRYINFLNGGDSYASRYVLSKVKDSYEKTKPKFIYSSVELITPQNESLIITYPKITKNFLLRSTINHQVIFADKELFKRSGPFDITLSICADYKWLLFVLLKLNTAPSYINEPLVRFYIGGLSSSNDLFKQRIIIQKEYYSFFTPYISYIIGASIAFINRLFFSRVLHLGSRLKQKLTKSTSKSGEDK